MPLQYGKVFLEVTAEANSGLSLFFIHLNTALYQQTCHAMSEKCGCKLSITLVLLATGSGTDLSESWYWIILLLILLTVLYVPYFLIKLLQSAFGGCYCASYFATHFIYSMQFLICQALSSAVNGSRCCCRHLHLFFLFFLHVCALLDGKVPKQSHRDNKNTADGITVPFN